MQDRVPTPGQEGRVLITPESGSPYYAKIQMADNPTQAGTPLNKDTLLKDATAALFGFGVDALPDDMFNVLTHAGDLHVWKRTQDGVIDYPVSPNRNAYQEGTVDGTTVEYMGQVGERRVKFVSYVGTGTYGENNPCSITADFPIKGAILMATYYRKSNRLQWPSSAVLNISTDLLTESYSQYVGFTSNQAYMDYVFGKISSDKKTIYWYNTRNADQQLNRDDFSYHFLLLG